MANPTSRGIGTGTAQVFDTSRVDDAINRLADIKFRKDAMYGEAEAKQKAKKEAAISELRGEFKDYDTTKLRLADVDLFQEKKNSILNKYDGQWGKILNGDPQLANEYRRDVDDMKRLIARSVDTKTKAQKHLEEIAGNPLYSDEYVKNYQLKATEPGYVYEEDLRAGNLARDQIRPDFINNIAGLFTDKGEELYDIDKNEIPLGNGQTRTVETKRWKPDAEALTKFKATVGSDPEMLTDINIKYADIEIPEERIEAAYNDFKTSTQQEEDFKGIKGSARAPKEAKDPYAGISVTPYNLKGEEGVSIGGPKPLQPTNFSFKEDGNKSVMLGTPTEVFKDKYGNYKVRIVAKKRTTNEDGTIEDWVDTGEVKVIKVNEGGTAAAAFKNSYGKTPREFYKEGLSIKDENNDPLGLFK